MEKSTEAAINEYVSLVGGKKWEHITYHCTGRFHGKIDHSILIDDKIKLYIGTGMAMFEKQILKDIANLKDFKKNKEHYLELLQKQIEKDNALAEEIGLKTIKIIDIGQVSPEATDPYFFNKSYVLIEVNGKQFKHYTTNLDMAIKANVLEDYLNERNNASPFIAGGNASPDYVFCNMLFDSNNEIYKIM